MACIRIFVSQLRTQHHAKIKLHEKNRHADIKSREVSLIPLHCFLSLIFLDDKGIFKMKLFNFCSPLVIYHNSYGL